MKCYSDYLWEGGRHLILISFSLFLYIFQKFCNEHALLIFLEDTNYFFTKLLMT